MNNGLVERKSPNQRPEFGREITILKAGARIYVSLRSAVMALLASGGRLVLLPLGLTVSPTLNVSQTESTNQLY